MLNSLYTSSITLHKNLIMNSQQKMGTIDPTFPVIDLSILNSIDDHFSLENVPQIQKLVKKIGEACEKWGFFQVINHGVSLEMLKELDMAGRKFFALPMEEKNKIRRDANYPTGFLEGEHTENSRDWKEVFDFTVTDTTPFPLSPSDTHPKHFSNRFPSSPPELRGLAEGYAAEVEKLSYKLMGLVAMSLGLAPNRFDKFFEDHMCLIKLNYYPSCPNPDNFFGIAAHKDASVMTILAQDEVRGLQVRRRSDGEWVNVIPIPGSYIVNIGDIIQVWSNDKYQSIEHRVKVNSEKERVSIAYFVHPAHSTMAEPFDELISDNNPARYKPLRFGELYATKRKNDLRKVNTELVGTELLQITHFKINQ